VFLQDNLLVIESKQDGTVNIYELSSGRPVISNMNLIENSTKEIQLESQFVPFLLQIISEGEVSLQKAFINSGNYQLSTGGK
jgi:hypothetical protein